MRLNKIKQLSAGGERFIGWARTRAAQLNEFRIRHNRHFATKFYIVDGFTIRLQSTPNVDNIFITGGTGSDLIVFLSGGLLWGYDYLTNKIQRRTETTYHGTTLFQAGENLIGVGDGLFLTDSRKITNTGHPFATTAGVYIPSTNAGASINGFLVSIIRDNQPYVVATLDPATDWQSILSMPTSIGVLGTPLERWNKATGPEILEINPFEGFGSNLRWHWTPRIWYPDPENIAGLMGGIYYGDPFGQWFGPGEPEVTFGCVLQDRGGGEEGFCEVLTKITNEDGSVDDYIRVFFYKELWEAPKNFYYKLTIAGGFKSAYAAHSYWDDRPNEVIIQEFSGSLSIIRGDLEIFWWSAVPSGTATSLQGAIVVDPTGAYSVGRLTTYYNELFTGTGFIDYTVSSDGQTFAVFEGVEGIITRAIVYNLADRATLANSEAPAGKGIVAGELIPSRLPAEDITEVTLPEELVDLSTVGADVYVGPLSGMWFPYPANEGFSTSGWKVLITEGKYATGKFWSDDCWTKMSFTRTSFTGAGPAIDDLDNLLYFVNDPAHNIQEYGQGEFLADEGYPEDIGSPVFEADDRVFFGVSDFGCLAVSKNTAPPIEFTGDVADGPFEDCTILVTPEDCLGGVARMTDGCDRKAIYPVAPATGCCPGPDQLDYEVIGDSCPSGVARPTGGIGPYFYRYDLDQEGNETDCIGGFEYDGECWQAVDGDVNVCGFFTGLTFMDTCFNTISASVYAPTLVISGPDSISIGSTFSATGGNLADGPYVFSAGGVIFSGSEVIGFDGACGTAVVTVTDGAGNTDSKSVRVVDNGQWVFAEELWGNPCSLNPGAESTTIAVCEVISSTRKYIYRWATVNGYAGTMICNWSCANENSITTNPCTGAAITPCYSGAGYEVRFDVKYLLHVYTWECL